MTTSTPFRDLLHAANLRHGTESFTSPPKEGVLRIFFALKNPTVSAGFEPANLGTKGQHATPRPPKPLIKTISLSNITMLLCPDSSSDFLELLKNKTWDNLYALDVVQIHLIHFKYFLNYLSIIFSCSIFIHSVFCLTTGPKPPPKRCLHIVRCRASSFK